MGICPYRFTQHLPQFTLCPVILPWLSSAPGSLNCLNSGRFYPGMVFVLRVDQMGSTRPLNIIIWMGARGRQDQLRGFDFLSFQFESAAPLLPGQDNSGPSGPTSRSACFVVSCGFRLSEVGLPEIRKSQVV